MLKVLMRIPKKAMTAARKMNKRNEERNQIDLLFNLIKKFRMIERTFKIVLIGKQK